MPTVPRYSSPQVDQRPLPGPKTPTDLPVEAFGGGPSLDKVSGAARNLAQTGLDIYEQEKNKANQVAVLDAQNKLNQLSRTLTYDPKFGFINKRGKDAFSAPAQVEKGWQDGVAKIEEGLGNDAQKFAFKKLSTGEYDSLNDKLNNHVAQQAKEFDQETTNAAVKNAQDDVSLNPTNPKTVARSLQMQTDVLSLYAKRNGKSQEWLNEKIADAHSDLHVTAIDRMLDNKQPFQALAYYNANKTSILGKEYNRITNAIDAETLDAQARAGASDIINQTVNSKSGGVNFDIAKATELVDSIPDNKLREETRKQFDLQVRTIESSFDKNEAAGAGLIANNQMTQTWLDKNRNNITDSFYRSASYAMKNYGKPTASDSVKNSTLTSLLDQYTKIMDGDVYARTQKLMGYRTNVLSNVSKLDPDAFNKLLSYSDPNFVPPPEKEGFFKSAIKWIGENARRVGSEAGPAVMRFIDKASGAKPEDLPAIAQNSIRSDIYDKNPSLVGKADLSNNIVNQKQGPRQVYDGTTKLKPDQTLNVEAPKFKPGDERKKGDVTYVRQQDGTWLPKP